MKPIEYSKWDGNIPAMVLNMPMEAYHNHQGSISNSGLNLVSRSPAHYAFRAPWKATRAVEIGTAFHTALLEPERFKQDYMITNSDDRRVVEYKDAAKIYGNEKTLTKNEGLSVAVMSESIAANQAAAAIFKKKGWSEVSVFVTDTETGIVMRCRFDWLTNCGIGLDLKKTQDCREFAFSKSLFTYRYHCQAAMYAHIYQIATGEPLRAFRLLAVEEDPPCANVLYHIDPLALEYGHKQYREALNQYAQAVASDVWESYSGEGIVTLPEWVLNEIIEQIGV
jgi:exodeoxyribonuclease VIII